MSLAQTRAALYAVMLLTGLMAANLLFLQTPRHEPGNLASVYDGTAPGTLVTPAGFKTIEEGLGLKASGSGATTPVVSARETPLPPIEDTTVTAVQVIKGIQRELASRGYEAGVQDGVAGLMTRAAVMAYEHDHNLPLTGEPDDELLNMIVLGSAGPGPRARPVGTRRPTHAITVIRHVQKALKERGQDPGQTDGRLVPQTATAIRAFEKAHGLKETGRISGELVGRLATVEPSAKTGPRVAPVQRQTAAR